jgi:hypothetical protein
MTQGEFEALIADLSKRIDETISWTQIDKAGDKFEFRVKVISDSGEQMSIKGSHNRKLGKTSYTLFTSDRIYSVDHDRSHGDAGNFHVHTWDASKGKCIASPAAASIEVGRDPQLLWDWFCEQAHITHYGVLESLPPVQKTLGLF